MVTHCTRLLRITHNKTFEGLHMSPSDILSALSVSRPELYAEARADGYSFYLGPRSTGSAGSNRVVRVSCTSSGRLTKLKRAATALAHPYQPAEQEFRGNIDDLLVIVDAEIALVRSRERTK